MHGEWTGFISADVGPVAGPPSAQLDALLIDEGTGRITWIRSWRARLRASGLQEAFTQPQKSLSTTIGSTAAARRAGTTLAAIREATK